MNLYIFKFRGGSVISVPAKDKLAAVQTIAEKYHRLFEAESFEVMMVTTQIENSEPEEVDLEEYDNLV
jgi:hypothetical protein